MSSRPRWATWVLRHKRWFRASEEILHLLHAARDGTRLSTVLAGMGTVGQVTSALWPDESGWEILRNEGLSYHQYALGGLYCQLLSTVYQPQLVKQNNFSQTFIWYKGNGDPWCGMQLFGGSFGEGPFLPQGGHDFFSESVREASWRHPDMMVSANSGTRESTQGSDKYIFDPLPDPGPFISLKQPAWYVDRLQKYPPGPMTLLIRGPTGVGKSVLARHISRGLGREGSRTLKLSSKVMHSCPPNEILCMVKTLQPTVLLLDDLDLSDSSHTDTFLALLEAIRDPNCLVIVTMMMPPDHVEPTPKPGAWHFPGMRPGRIDEAFTLPLPGPVEREMILKHYGLIERVVEVAARCDGLSGAYLMEVARRIKTHGYDGWEHEVDLVKYMAPSPESKDEDDEDKDKNGGKSGTPTTSKT